MDEPRLKLARDLFLQLEKNGTASLWVARDQCFLTLDAEAFLFLQHFGDGSTPRQAAEASGLAFDEVASAMVENFIEQGLLLSVEPRPALPVTPAPRRDLARSRVNRLLDAGSFQEEESRIPHVVTGFGTVGGRTVAVVAFDPDRVPQRSGPTEPAGTLSRVLEKVLRLQERVLRDPCPVIYLFDEVVSSGGEDSDDFFVGRNSFGRIYRHQALLASVAPQLGAVLGDLLMPTAFPSALCDVLAMVRSANVHIAQPSTVAVLTGETVDVQELGGAAMHCRVSGLGDALAETDDEALTFIRRVLPFFPGRTGAPPPRQTPRAPARSGKSLREIVPPDGGKPFPMMRLVTEIVDADSAVELKRDHAGEILTALAHLDGIPIGIVGNDSSRKGGVLTIEACRKAARFIERCDVFDVPLLFLMDVPGFAIGKQAEQGGILPAAAAFFTALARASVPRISVVVRKAHTAGLWAMAGPPFDPDAFLALPTALIAVMGARAQIPTFGALDRATPEHLRDDLHDLVVAGMAPELCAERRVVDDVVELPALRDALAGRLGRMFGRRRDLF